MKTMTTATGICRTVHVAPVSAFARLRADLAPGATSGYAGSGLATPGTTDTDPNFTGLAAIG
ncbi:hypothetical protein ACO0LV_08915 [Pseudactinotalea sp. Z1739]|uniref:hypothetical protein n=1 Tax=Pseudactinotalea sp. Z1739 TaxID=3413028 RepID=UPI003C7C0F7B